MARKVTTATRMPPTNSSTDCTTSVTITAFSPPRITYAPVTTAISNMPIMNHLGSTSPGLRAALKDAPPENLTCVPARGYPPPGSTKVRAITVSLDIATDTTALEIANPSFSLSGWSTTTLGAVA